ncbi:unnamed protein product [Lampetra fluviatilis]
MCPRSAREASHGGSHVHGELGFDLPRKLRSLHQPLQNSNLPLRAQTPPPPPQVENYRRAASVCPGAFWEPPGDFTGLIVVKRVGHRGPVAPSPECFSFRRSAQAGAVHGQAAGVATKLTKLTKPLAGPCQDGDGGVPLRESERWASSVVLSSTQHGQTDGQSPEWTVPDRHRESAADTAHGRPAACMEGPQLVWKARRLLLGSRCSTSHVLAFAQQQQQR